MTADLEHILTSGQSLSTGVKGSPIISETSEVANARRINPNNGAIGPLTAEGTTQYPDVSMGYRIAEHVGPSQIIGASTHGSGGASLAELSPGGSTGRYEQTINCVAAVHAATVAAGQTYAVRAFHWIHGETDQADPAISRPGYLSAMVNLYELFKSDIAAIVGAAQDFPWILSQTATWGHFGGGPAKTGLAQLDAHRDVAGMTLACPQYQLDYDLDHAHLTPRGYYHLGELHARAHNVILDGGQWSPLTPIGYSASGTTVRVKYHVPNGPLVFDTTAIPAQPDMGFSLSGTSAQITQVAIIAPDTVAITTDRPITEPTVNVGYGVTYGAKRGLGNLRDSDPTTSAYDGAHLPNWAVHSLDAVPVAAPPYVPPPWVMRATDAFVLDGSALRRLTLG